MDDDVNQSLIALLTTGARESLEADSMLVRGGGAD